MRDERTPDLFTRRTRKPKPPPEIALHGQIADTLRLDLAPGWVWFHPANGELRDDAAGRKLKRMGVRPGVSDIILFGPPHATVHALEIKAKGNHLTEAQIRFMHETLAAGGKAEWTNDFRQAVAILTKWGALRREITVQ